MKPQNTVTGARCPKLHSAPAPAAPPHLPRHHLQHTRVATPRAAPESPCPLPQGAHRRCGISSSVHSTYRLPCLWYQLPLGHCTSWHVRGLDSDDHAGLASTQVTVSASPPHLPAHFGPCYRCPAPRLPTIAAAGPAVLLFTATLGLATFSPRPSCTVAAMAAAAARQQDEHSTAE